MADSFIQPGKANTFAKGDRVTVFSLSFQHRPIIEGVAEIVSKAHGYPPGFHWVRFEDERQARVRFVYGGDWQSDPEGILASLLTDWRANLTA